MVHHLQSMERDTVVQRLQSLERHSVVQLPPVDGACHGGGGEVERGGRRLLEDVACRHVAVCQLGGARQTARLGEGGARGRGAGQRGGALRRQLAADEPLQLVNARVLVVVDPPAGHQQHHC